MPDPEATPPGGALQRAIPRAALERVLARAAQLQAAGGDRDEAGTMTEEQLVALGGEVGLSAELIRQALAEERSRTLMPAESGRLFGIMGPSALTASRSVAGSPAAVLGALDAWMQRNELLQVKRRFADQLVWESRRDLLAVLRRTFRGRALDLIAANDVSAIVAEVAAGRSHVRLVADFTVTRARRATIGGVIALLSLAGVAPLIAIGVDPALAAVPALLGALLSLFVTRRVNHALAARAQVALEQALDRLEFAADAPPSAARALLDTIIGPPRPPG